MSKESYMATNEKAINLETLGAFKDEADKAYQAKLTAGENITISEDNVISASGDGMSTVNTAEPISGDGSVENPITADTFDVDYQQITHDDSLVHVSNNAQYALGVNTKMFPDETVLWSSTSPVATCILKEPLSNFERVKIYATNVNSVGTCNEFDLSLGDAQMNVRWNVGTGDAVYERLAYISVSNGNVLTVSKTLQRKVTYATSPTVSYAVDGHKSCIVKVIGVGRKGGN